MRRLLAIPLRYSSVDCCTHRIQMMIDINICEPQHLQSKGFQVMCSLKILGLLFRVVVLRAVKLYDQQSLCAIKVNNILSQRTLPAKLYRMISQKTIPEGVFFFCCILTKLLRKSFDRIVLFHINFILTPHPTSLTLGHLPPQGEGIQGIILFFFRYRSSSEKTQPQYFCM